MLDKYPYPEDWHRIYFSNKVNFGYKTKNKLGIIRKVGMRYCQGYIEEMQGLTKKN